MTLCGVRGDRVTIGGEYRIVIVFIVNRGSGTY